MSHLTDFQVQEFASGDCFFLLRVFRELHLRHCAECRRKVEICREVLSEQQSLGSALKEYREFEVQANSTMKAPKA